MPAPLSVPYSSSILMMMGIIRAASHPALLTKWCLWRKSLGAFGQVVDVIDAKQAQTCVGIGIFLFVVSAQ